MKNLKKFGELTEAVKFDDFKYLPEVPPKGVDVLLAIKDADCLIQGYFENDKFIASKEFSVHTIDTYTSYSKYELTDVYAWCELPEMPPIK